MARLDVRSTLAAGDDPFGEIMAVVSGLAPDEDFELLAPLDPVPLYDVLARRGFEHVTQPLGGGDYLITFRRAVSR